jgi:cysteine sulfinate desulfinase/cysteine desulfurase-like protein
MGITPEGPYAVLRFSFGPTTTEDEIGKAASAVTSSIHRLREAGA